VTDATRGVRRLTIIADQIPPDFPIHASAITIDYDYVAINNHDYLLPVSGELLMKLGKSRVIMHRIKFLDYHRFSSETRILSFRQQSAREAQVP